MGHGKSFCLTIVAAIVITSGARAAQTATDGNPAAKSWWAHVQYLADDKLEGRHTGSAGFKVWRLPMWRNSFAMPD
jgi:hypothetical protein